MAWIDCFPHREESLERFLDNAQVTLQDAIEKLINYSEDFTDEQMLNLYRYSGFNNGWLSKEAIADIDTDFFKYWPLFTKVDNDKREFIAPEKYAAIRVYISLLQLAKGYFDAEDQSLDLADFDASRILVRPYDFIGWAMGMKSIKVPQPMIDWKNHKDGKNENEKLEGWGQIEHFLGLTRLTIQRKKYPVYQAGKKTRVWAYKIELLKHTGKLTVINRD